MKISVISFLISVIIVMHYFLNYYKNQHFKILNIYIYMNPYHKYMLLYTSLQAIGVGAIIKFSEWEKLQREKFNK